MFKSLLLYKIKNDFRFDFTDMENGIKKGAFEECGATQKQSVGWIPPRREEHGALIEVVNGQWLMTQCVEKKLLPGTVVNRELDKRIQLLVAKEGRKPGKKQTKELKEEVVVDLLANSHTSIAHVGLWIDPESHRLAIDTSSQAVADQIVTRLVEAWPGFAVSLINTTSSPQALMTEWLFSNAPAEGFSLGRECELKSTGEDKSVVRYGRHPLDIEEIKTHIQQGKLPTKLALEFDDRVAFTITEGFRLTKVQVLDVAIVESSAKAETIQEQFDADAVLITSELRAVIDALLSAMGGELDATDAPGAFNDRALITEGKNAPAGGAASPGHSSAHEAREGQPADAPWL